MPLVTAVIDPNHVLLTRRRALVDELSAIDRDIALEASSQLREALRAATVTGALPAPAPQKLLSTTAHGTHAKSARAAGLVVAHEREIKTALVAGPLSAKAIARSAGLKRDDVKRAVKQLLKLGRIRKNGTRGPSVTWQLATGQPAPTPVASSTARPSAPATHRAVVSFDSAADEFETEFETVWPPAANPKASVRETLTPGAGK